MTLLPRVKLKTLPTFPSNIVGGTGLTSTKQNGAVTLDFAWQEFGTISAIPTSPTSNILTYDTATNAYVMVPSHLLGGATAGIADAPVTGLIYGRQSAAWTPLTGDVLEQMLLFTQTGAGAVQRFLDAKIKDYGISVRDFGAVGNGIADDTAAIQAAVTAASPKGIVFFPAGVYQITSSINITSGIILRGVGIEAIDKGLTLGSIIKVMGNIVGFNITCDDALVIENMEFVGGTVGNSAVLIRIDTDNSTSLKCNLETVIRDCMFTTAGIGIYAPNILGFTFDNCYFFNISGQSCRVEAANSLGNGDAIITNCTFSGGPTNGHVATGTCGGLRIENNKFNMPGVAGQSAAIIIGQGGTVATAFISPLFIIGNSIESAQYGVIFQRSGAGTMGSAGLVISNNEIVISVAGGVAIFSQVSGGNSGMWVSGGIITGNYLFAANVAGLSLIALDAASDINIAANLFMTNATATAVSLGGTTARIAQNANMKGLNVA